MICLVIQRYLLEIGIHTLVYKKKLGFFVSACLRNVGMHVCTYVIKYVCMYVYVCMYIFIDLMAAKISFNVRGFAMSSWSGY